MRENAEESEQGDVFARRLVYLYFFLLIIEGALRKWMFKSISGPLLIVRDPVVLMIYARLLMRRRFPWNGWVNLTIGLGAACAAASLAAGCPLSITLFGVRTDFWQIPLIFVLPRILGGGDARRIGRWMLAAMPLMALLALLQFRAGPDHWLNATTGGSDSSQQLYAAAGRVRPSGTFSFVTGMVAFLSLGSAFVFQGFLEGGGLRLWIATVGMVLALGVSGSRSAILEVGIVGIAAVFTCLREPAQLRRVLTPLIIGALAFAALQTLEDFRQGLDVNRSRFDSAGGLKEGILYRWFGDYASAWEMEHVSPMLGYGLGLGTNVGAGLATGIVHFMLAEGEWARIILESGPILGVGVILLRLGIALHLLRRSLAALRSRGDPLPILLLAASMLDIATGQWGQATVSGFAVFAGGLCLACAHGDRDEEEDEEDNEEQEPPPVERKPRGRGACASTIKGGRG